MSAAKDLFLRANRALEPIIPLTLLWLLMWPLAAYLGARHLRLVSDRVPARSLPLAESSPKPSTWRRWLYLARIQADFFVLTWIDRLSARRCQSRFKAEGGGSDERPGSGHLSAVLLARRPTGLTRLGP